jgi:hypothetical protein
VTRAGSRTRPRDVSPLEPAEFGIAFQLALDAGQSSDNASSSSPYERASFALKRYFADRTDTFVSADFRFRALMDLYTRDVLVDWVRSGSGGSVRTEIHPAVLDVASRLRLASNGKFPVRKFLEDVTQTARSNYADLDQWPLGDFP